MRLERAVLDASVVLKWYLSDEQDGEKALSLLGEYVSGKLNILAPSLLEYEVVNGLIIAKRRGRIEEEKLLTAIYGFLNLEIVLKNFSMFSDKTLHYCKVYNRSIYDASYLALAREEGVPLITSDSGIYNAVRKDIEWVKWLGDL